MTRSDIQKGAAISGLINAAIKDRDIALRGDGEDGGVGDAEVLGILGKMVKQRQESARAYEEGGRLELAEKERGEVTVIEEFLPRQLTEDEVGAAIAEAIVFHPATPGAALELLATTGSSSTCSLMNCSAAAAVSLAVSGSNMIQPVSPLMKLMLARS